MSRAKEDLTGKIFGYLTVISFAYKDGKYHMFWNCLCKCGKSRVVQGYNLTNKRGLIK